MSVTHTLLTPSDLRYLLIDSLKVYSDDVAYIGGNNPYHISVNNKLFYIYVKNTHSSGLGRDNPDESRIQIGHSSAFDAVPSNELIYFLGYSPIQHIFTAWDPKLLHDRINLKQTVSVYSRFSIQDRAQTDGIALFENNSGHHIISFKPEYLGLYLDNAPIMHTLSEDSLLKLITSADSIESTESTGDQVELEDESATVIKRRDSRDPAFKRMVNEAYGSRCAFSGIQLDIVEAAHIVPHSHEMGDDDVNNGIGLSPLHHRAYDHGLIYFDEEFKIHINKEKVEYLEKIGRDGGLNKFISITYDVVNLPKLEHYYPSKDKIRLANTIRGIISSEL